MRREANTVPLQPGIFEKHVSVPLLLLAAFVPFLSIFLGDLNTFVMETLRGAHLVAKHTRNGVFVCWRS